MVTSNNGGGSGNTWRWWKARIGVFFDDETKHTTVVNGCSNYGVDTTRAIGLKADQSGLAIPGDVPLD